MYMKKKINIQSVINENIGESVMKIINNGGINGQQPINIGENSAKYENTETAAGGGMAAGIERSLAKISKAAGVAAA